VVQLCEHFPGGARASNGNLTLPGQDLLRLYSKSWLTMPRQLQCRQNAPVIIGGACILPMLPSR
jgi:hypothetical protein